MFVQQQAELCEQTVKEIESNKISATSAVEKVEHLMAQMMIQKEHKFLDPTIMEGIENAEKSKEIDGNFKQTIIDVAVQFYGNYLFFKLVYIFVICIILFKIIVRIFFR